MSGSSVNCLTPVVKRRGGCREPITGRMCVDIAKDKWKRPILEIISRSEEPVGSWFIVSEFKKQNVDVSSATIGRELNELETLGYVERIGFKGRVITALGLRTIDEVRTTQTLDYYRNSLDALINSDVMENFLMVLEARLTIERQTARLAAERITEEGMAELIDRYDRQKDHERDNLSIAKDDIAFHGCIARHSGNKALYSIYMMLSAMGQQSELFEQLRHRVGDNYTPYHSKVMDAIKAHDPDRAEEAMSDHITKLMLDVNQYWNEYIELKNNGNVR